MFIHSFLVQGKTPNNRRKFVYFSNEANSQKQDSRMQLLKIMYKHVFHVKRKCDKKTEMLKQAKQRQHCCKKISMY